MVISAIHRHSKPRRSRREGLRSPRPVGPGDSQPEELKDVDPLHATSSNPPAPAASTAERPDVAVSAPNLTAPVASDPRRGGPGPGPDQARTRHFRPGSLGPAVWTRAPARPPAVDPRAQPDLAGTAQRACLRAAGGPGARRSGQSHYGQTAGARAGADAAAFAGSHPASPRRAQGIAGNDPDRPFAAGGRPDPGTRL